MATSSNSQEKGLDFPCVTIGVLTALEEEYAACRGVFDPDETGVEKERSATSGALTCYICRIPGKHGGEHIIAITRLPTMGNTAAAIAANILLQHCTNVRHLIMCGIAGAVPHPKDAGHHVRLGDIVVSNAAGIIQYDFGKQRDLRNVTSDPFAGFEFRAPPRAPSEQLLAAVGRMQAEERLMRREIKREWEKKIDAFIKRYGQGQKWKRPTGKKDKLIDSLDGSGNATPHPKGKRRSGKPKVFLGPIGAANIVLADPRKRDALRDRWKIKAVEMEGSGIADASWVAGIGYIVIRGICDYCNSTKNDDWHDYAAVIAAAYTRTLIENLHLADSAAPVSFTGATEQHTIHENPPQVVLHIPGRMDTKSLVENIEPTLTQNQQQAPLKHQDLTQINLVPKEDQGENFFTTKEQASETTASLSGEASGHSHIKTLVSKLDIMVDPIV